MSMYEVIKDESIPSIACLNIVGVGNCFIYDEEVWIILSLLAEERFYCLCFNNGNTKRLDLSLKVTPVRKVKITYEI